MKKDAISSLRSLSQPQRNYWNSHTPHSFATLSELLKDNLIDTELASGKKSGYNFVLIADKKEWSCKASPDRVGETGQRSFFIDQTNIIRVAENGEADKNNQPLYFK